MSPDRTLVLVRERSFLELLDLALVVVKRRPLVLALWLAVGATPCVLIDVWLLDLIGQAVDQFPRLVPWTVLLGMQAPWATAPLTIVLGGLMFGERPSARRVVRGYWNGTGPLLLYQFLMRGAMLFVWLLAPLLFSKFRFLNEVTLLERGPVGAVAGRCWSLTLDRGANMLGRWVLQVAATGLFVVAFTYAMGNFQEVVFRQGLPDLNMIAILRSLGEFSVTGWAMQSGAWLGIGFFTVVRFLEYIDQRTRLEGWEIELRMRVLGGLLEDEERW